MRERTEKCDESNGTSRECWPLPGQRGHTRERGIDGGTDGIVTMLNRNKLLPAEYGGSWAPALSVTPEVPAGTTTADATSDADVYGAGSPTVGFFQMSPDQGGHTSDDGVPAEATDISEPQAPREVAFYVP